MQDINAATLSAIGGSRADVVGRPLWEGPWFSNTPGLTQVIRDAVTQAGAGRTVRSDLRVNLPGGPRSFHFSLRPVFGARKQVIGLVPEAVELRP